MRLLSDEIYAMVWIFECMFIAIAAASRERYEVFFGQGGGIVFSCRIHLIMRI